MSSWKKAAKAGQKTHRERHQPESRQHLGLLEKKKDYKLRAQDYNEKQATLKLLKKRALNKNPDEFYFHMINSKMDKGVHREKEKKEENTIEQIRLMETQDLKYIAHKRHLEARQVEKLQSQLHMIDVANQTPNNHIFFVDDDEEAKNFDVAKRLETHPALLSRKTNRPKLSALKKAKLPELDEATIAKIEQQKHMAYTELRKRIDRETGLTIVQQKLEMRRALKDRTLDKPKVVKQGSKTSAPVYKWKLQRKK
ncbi:probable U3 small nucleolar RNA-associated protein 11 [Microplitis mediator]|uniref:probable U3 small nucleolar RNA-associated protein 11 n=1 Tax=Microplitis mediator TaxID=375433 RepID=UPI00255685D1|nr:probable U3 small nucleolar RNA-associated protein 11 [Microplitis mediator]